MLSLRGLFNGSRAPRREPPFPFWQPLAIASAVSAFCVLLLFSRPSVIGYLDNRIYDNLVSKAPRNTPTNQTIMVDIDDLSLAKIGRWPWRPAVLATLIDKLHAAKVSSLALDIMFPEPDPQHTLDDRKLAAALSHGSNVIGFEFLFDTAHNEPTSCPIPPKPLIPPQVFSPLQAGIRLPEPIAIICDVSPSLVPAATSGFINAPRDRDGILRRLPLLMAFRGAIYPSFALTAAISSSASDSAVLARGARDLLWLQWNGKRIALTDGANLFLRYRGPRRTLPRLSAYEVIAGLVSPDRLTGKIVVLGSSARGLQESVEIRLDPAFPALEVQATFIDNLIAGDYFYTPRWAELFEIVTILLASFITVGLLYRSSATVGICSTFLLAAVVWAISQEIIFIKSAFASPLFGIGASFGTLGIYAVRTVFREGRVGREKQAQLAVSNRFITGALGAMTAVRDVETGQHVIRIQAYLRSLCEVVARKRRFADYLTPEMIDLLVQLAPIHDIGKVGVPDHILRKPGALTLHEFEQMKSHVTLGRKILEEAREHSGLRDEVFFQTAIDIVYSHHERWDGTGYPLGLSADAIPVPGRLLALADVYDALISKRHYKPEILHAEAVDRIRSESGTHFDPEIVAAFLAVQDDWRRMAEAHRDEPGAAASANSL